METTKSRQRFVEWFSAEDMHKASQNWLSKLLFIKDEHQFLADLVKTFSLQLITTKDFSSNKEIIDAINRSQRRNNALIKTVREHENGLKVMVDGKDELEKEEAYKDEHRNLIITISEFIKEYRGIKSQLFDILKKIRKREKLERLIDNK